MSHTATQTLQKPVLAATEAVLCVADFQRSCDYFVTKLGFVIEFARGEPPFHGRVKREREQLLSAALTVGTAAKIKALFAEFQAAGAGFLQKFRTEPWGERDFILRDPDGNLLLFAGPADADSSGEGAPA